MMAGKVIPKNPHRSLCVTPGCGRDNAKGSIVRGLCTRCITAARKWVKDNHGADEAAGWAALEAAGLALPPTHGGGGPSGASPFGAALKAALAAAPAPAVEAPADEPVKPGRKSRALAIA